MLTTYESLPFPLYNSRQQEFIDLGSKLGKSFLSQKFNELVIDGKGDVVDWISELNEEQILTNRFLILQMILKNEDHSLLRESLHDKIAYRDIEQY
jgi:hypothetical protein